MSGSQDPIAATTLANVARGAWDGVSANYPVFQEIKKAGGVEYDVAGGSDGSQLNSSTYELSGAIEAGRQHPSISAPGTDISALYVHKQRHKRWTGSFGEIVNGQAFDRGAMRRNKGSQIVDLSKTELPSMVKDTIVGTNGLAHQILQMNASVCAATGLPIYGLPTLLPGNGYDGVNTYNMGALSTGASATTGTASGDYALQGFTAPTGSGSGTLTGAIPASTDKEVAITSTSLTYLGLPLKPGAITGVDSAQWDAWTPTLVNTAASGWTGTAQDEDDAIEKFLSYLVFRLSRFSSSDKSKLPNVGLLDRNFFEYLGAKKSSRETIFVTPDQKSPIVPDTSWPVHFIFHAGVRWFWDENMPVDTAYCYSAQQMKLKVQPLYRDLEQGNPLKVSGEDAGILETEITRDPNRRQWLASATFPGQLICSPRYFGRASKYSGAV